MEHLSIEARGRGTVLVRIHRPEKRNALDRATKQELVEALDQLENDDRCRVVVLTGTGNSFVSGADIAELADASPFDYRASRHMPRPWERLDRLEKPAIAMINGWCLGGGLELALACDLRLAARSARLGLPEVRIGAVPGAGGTQRLPRLIGQGRAMRLILTGEAVDAETALSWGLVDQVFPDHDLEAATLELAASIARNSPVAVRLAKSAVRMSARLPLDAGLAYEGEVASLCFASEDHAEGMRAFLERREPQFRGR